MPVATNVFCSCHTVILGMITRSEPTSVVVHRNMCNNRQINICEVSGKCVYMNVPIVDGFSDTGCDKCLQWQNPCAGQTFMKVIDIPHEACKYITGKCKPSAN